jgi:hypothetical protein
VVKFHPSGYVIVKVTKLFMILSYGQEKVERGYETEGS